MKLAKLILSLITLVQVGACQTVKLPVPPSPVLLNNYVEEFPTQAYADPGNAVIVTAHPIKTGTFVQVWVEGMFPAPSATIVKTTAPLVVQIPAGAVGVQYKLVVAYSSDQ